jgi:hypothetical protein
MRFPIQTLTLLTSSVLTWRGSRRQPTCNARNAQTPVAQAPAQVTFCESFQCGSFGLDIGAEWSRLMLLTAYYLERKNNARDQPGRHECLNAFLNTLLLFALMLMCVPGSNTTVIVFFKESRDKYCTAKMSVLSLRTMQTFEACARMYSRNIKPWVGMNKVLCWFCFCIHHDSGSLESNANLNCFT